MREQDIMAENPEPMRGRPREFSEEAVMTALLDLFWGQGYEGTSLNDIMQATGLKKGSLYSLFGGKRDMYLKALRRYDRDYAAQACHMLKDNAQGSPAQRLDKFLSLPIEAAYGQNDQRGCFLCNASAEMAAHDAEMGQFIKASYESMIAALTVPLKALLPPLSADKIQSRAAMILSVYSGLRIMSRSGLAKDMMIEAKTAALDFIEPGL